MPYLLRAKIAVRRSVKVRPDEIVHFPIGNFLACNRLNFGSFCVFFLSEIIDRVITRSTRFPYV